MKKRIWIPSLIILFFILLIQILYVPKTEEEYYQRMKQCSNLSKEVDRDYCRSVVTEMYLGER